MPTALKKENDFIKVKQYITDRKGHKIAAIIEIEELKRLGELIEDIKAIEDKKNAPEDIVKIIKKKGKAFRSIRPIRGKGIPASKLLIEDRR